MKSFKYFFSAIVFSAFCLIPNTLVAQQGGQDRGYYGKMFDPQTMETISGEVTRVEKTANGKNIALKTEKGEMMVHLGPDFFLDQQEVQIKPQDKITVTGSKVTIEGKTYIIASEVKKEGKTLMLRDKLGVPVWRR